MAVPEQRTNRIAPRIPFYVPVVASGMRRCWTTNISIGGVGLTGLVAESTVPQQGDDLELELRLDPDASRPLRAVARVAWTGRLHPDGRLGLGVQFRDLSPYAQGQLARFLTAHRPRVMVALGSSSDHQLARHALADQEVEAISGLDELDPAVLRSCASIVAFPRDLEQLTEFLDTVHTLCPEVVPSELPLAPVTVCTDIDSERLLSLFSQGRIYEVLRPPQDRAMLQRAVERSCERWALQVEVQWTSLRLETLAAPPPRPQSPALDLDLSKHPT